MEPRDPGSLGGAILVKFSIIVLFTLPPSLNIYSIPHMAGAPRAPPPLGLDAALAVALVPLTNRMNGMQGQLNGLQGQLNLVQANQLNMQGQLNAVIGQLAVINGQLAVINGQLAVINPVAIAAAAVQSINAFDTARRLNQHSLRGVLFTPVPRADGTPPPSWPAAGFDRAALVEGPIATVDALLGDYGIPAGAGVGAPVVRRIALAQALGTASV